VSARPPTSELPLVALADPCSHCGCEDEEVPELDCDKCGRKSGDTELNALLYRRRGRPRLDPSARRRGKLIVSLTGDELEKLTRKAASLRDHKDRPLKLQDWAREVLMAAAEHEKEDDGAQEG